MKRVRSRGVSSLVAILVLAVSATIAMYPTAGSAATKYHFVFLTQSTGKQIDDAQVGKTITAAAFNDTTTFVQVALLDGSNNLVTNSPVSVTFQLASGPGLASGSLSVTAQPTVNGIATFGVGTLSIGTSNEPQFTDYALIPVSAKGPTITGLASSGFDIWDAGCSPACPIDLTTGKFGSDDSYTDATGTFLSASSLPGGLGGDLPGLKCDGQTLIFSDSLFTHESGDNTTVSLTTHVTKRDMKAAANNGQAHVQWCVGLATEQDWTSVGVTDAVHENTDGVGTGDAGLDLWVHVAPPCPNVANPQAFAPCIAHQFGDGSGGSYTQGYLPGDPPRRT